MAVDLIAVNGRIDFLISQFNFYANTRYKKSTEPLRRKLEPIASSEQYDRMEVCDFFKEQANNGNTDIYRVIDMFVDIMQDKERVAKKDAQAAFNETSALNFLGGVVTNIISEMKIDEIKDRVSEKLRDDIRSFIAENYGPIKRKIEITVNDKKAEFDGVIHSKFDTVMKFVSANEPVFLTGPAGSGKNVICKQVAKSLGLDFYFSNAVTQEYKLTGFTDANGVYHETQFYKAFKNGGVFMLDEMDASIPEVLIILNAAIANRYFDFPAPIGYVEANENFRVVAAGNTYGHGADYEYVGRSQLDAASLDRFAMVRIDYDSRIEEACACGNMELLRFCRAFRKASQKSGLHVIVSYRAISRMAKLLQCMTIKDVLDTCLIKGLEVDDLKGLEKDLLGYGEFSKSFTEIITDYKNA